MCGQQGKQCLHFTVYLFFLAFVGILRWQNRIWSLVSEFVKQKKLHKDNSSQTTNTAELKQIELEIHDARNYFLLEVNCYNC